MFGLLSWFLLIINDKVDYDMILTITICSTIMISTLFLTYRAPRRQTNKQPDQTERQRSYRYISIHTTSYLHIDAQQMKKDSADLQTDRR